MYYVRTARNYLENLGLFFSRAFPAGKGPRAKVYYVARNPFFLSRTKVRLTRNNAERRSRLSLPSAT